MDNAIEDLEFRFEFLRVGHRATRFSTRRAEPIVLLHPFSLCPEVWKPILPELEKHHPVYSLGLPGHHGTDPLPHDFDHSIESAVDLMEQKLDEVGIERAHLVGNSLGGWIAIELARRGRALSVVAIAPGGGWEAGSPEEERLVRKFKLTNLLLRLGGPLSLMMANYALTRRVFLGDAVARPERLEPEDAALFIDAARRCTCYMGIVEALPRQPAPSAFEALPCPIRVIWGTHDRVLPLEGYSGRWQRLLTGADWVTIENVGHVPMYDDPKRVAEAILEWTRSALGYDEPPRLAS
ncbi:MAG: alpha/beta hydrolase [Myxococcales bacterium]